MGEKTLPKKKLTKCQVFLRGKNPVKVLLSFFLLSFSFIGGAEVTKLELIINKFIEKVRTFEMFELGRMIDGINLKNKIA